ncbi:MULTISPECIES: YdhK family protein [Mesobacillus]|uniref:DUF1541 domain-containing protein n=2 Tax=Mesobacillus TaxID=2675231 RepID=A0A0D6Z556_9BACI|nr:MULTISPECIES: YdhK family protein [Mesobacillus]KIY20854.1 hypothetical protein UB32_16940 [Mesobacillus subterraneus]MDQ0412604.1 putative heme/steroid binding protein [Mesobacillus stamsii]
MKTKKLALFVLGFITALVLAACSDTGNEKGKENTSYENNEGDHAGMNHSGSGEVPEGLKEAENPAFEVGREIVVNSDHMQGMNGAAGTIVGAYDTTVYAVSYTPTTGGEKISNHKWVIHEELENAADQPYKPGDEVVLMADHMKGMNGATATIDTAEQTTVYMIDFTPTSGGAVVKNHKWVTEEELTSAN